MTQENRLSALFASIRTLWAGWGRLPYMDIEKTLMRPVGWAFARVPLTPTLRKSTDSLKSTDSFESLSMDESTVRLGKQIHIETMRLPKKTVQAFFRAAKHDTQMRVRAEKSSAKA